MMRKHAELEKELIDDLLPRTGKTLAQWMAEIDATGLTGKNEIIDWLRPRGFTFSNASWLERIHNNGGRPIYLDGAAAIEPEGQGPPAAVPAPPSGRPSPPAPIAKPPAPLPQEPPPVVLPQAGSLADTLARGKAFRPLAEMVVRQIEAALPGVALGVAGDLVAFGKPREVAVLHVSPRELRLGLALGEQAPGEGLTKARIPGVGGHITHMVTLTDARQVGPALLEHVRSADRLANPV
jgi:hypothetical protein